MGKYFDIFNFYYITSFVKRWLRHFFDTFHQPETFLSHQHGDFIMSDKTEKPKTQADEPQEKMEQVETLPQPPEEEAVKSDDQVVKDESSSEGDSQTTNSEEKTEPEEKPESPQSSLPLTPPPMSPLRKAVLWTMIICLALFTLYQCGYSRGQSEEHLRNALRPPEEKVIIQTDLKAIDEAVKNERAKQRVLTEVQLSMFVNGLEKNLDQLKSELEYRQLWERFESGEDAGRCTKGAYSGQVSCTSGLRADLNEYLARLEVRNVCASGEWTAVQSDAPTESTASEASAPQSAPPQVEYQDELVLKFCQRPEFRSPETE